MKKITFALFALMLLITALSFADDKKDEKPDTTVWKDEKPFADVIKGFKEIPGLFTIYYRAEDNKAYVEIKPEQLDKVHLCSVTMEAGDGYYFDSGAMLDNFPFIFKRIGKRIQFLHKNVYFRADSGSPLNRAIPRGVTNSLIGSAKIESRPHPDRKSFLIDPSSLFIQDYAFVSYSLSEFAKINFNLDKENSYFSELKSFPNNAEFEATLTFTTGQPKGGFGPIASTRSIQHRMHYSLSTLPESNYMPRLADDRVGHFLTMYQDYTKDTEDSPYRRYVNRWRLEKSDPNASLSPPKEPIVYWLENTIPLEYRDAVTQGLLAWNKAFERIGFKDAIIAKQMPDTADWDPADVRYHTIRWIVMPGGGYAVGPSLTNPYTGEIYDADIRISADITRYVLKEYEEFVNPIGLENKPKLPLTVNSQYACNFADGMMREAAFGWNMMEARGLLDDATSKKYVNDFIIGLVAHEVGHTLGLRHNFRSSVSHKLDELQNEKLTLDEGIAGSVMDYAPVNIAPDGRPQGQYWQTTLGTYDYWAIEYAYKPVIANTPDEEVPELNKIASKVSDPKLAYGTDEDAFGLGARGIDPVTNVWDLGDDPLAYYKKEISLVKELWSKLETKFNTPGTRYQKLRRVFGQGFREFALGGLTASKYIGGIYHYRDHIGDPGNRVPYEPVPASKQREAFEFLKTNILGANAFNFPPSLLNKLGIERYEDFEGSSFMVQRNDYPLHTVILSVQRSPLDRLYYPVTLNRLVDTEMRYKNPKDKFTLAEMFKGMREAIWSELSAGKNINSFRRGLQRVHIDKLVELLLKPQYDTPEDARTLARADLVTIQKGIDRTSKGSDDATLAHLDETRARIDAALKASLQRNSEPQ